MPDDSLLMGVVTGGTGDAPSRHHGEEDQVPLLGLVHGVKGLRRGAYEKVGAENPAKAYLTKKRIEK
jgi:hypothetical protein